MTSVNRFRLALVGLAFIVTAPVWAGEPAYDLDIEPQPLAQALKAFAEQSGLQVVYYSELADGEESPEVSGTMTADQAMAQLLASTDLTFDTMGEDTVVVETVNVSTVDDDNVGGDSDSKNLTSTPVLMAQNQNPLANWSSETAEEPQEQVGGKVRRFDEIIVTGTNIRGVYPESQPLDVYTAEDIALSGATTLERFFETLPQNLNSFAAGATNLGPGDSGDFVRGGGIDLRGLGVGTTLVLLNGRRLTAPGGRSVDTSLIPLGAVKRVEVLTDGASATYGSDAIGGVVNFILRDDFEGVNAGASYGGATRGAYDRFQADFAAGTSWGSGSGFFSYSYTDQSDLDAAERRFSSVAAVPQSLIPSERKHGILGAIDQEATERLKLSGNVFYSRRESSSEANTFGFVSLLDGVQEQIFVSGGAEYQIHDDLFFQIDATYLTYEQDSTSELSNSDGGRSEEKGDSLDLSAKFDGPLIAVPGGEAKFSIGGGYSRQDFRSAGGFVTDPELEFSAFDRDSYFVFVEVFAPLVSEEQDIRGINRLELNAAARYTDYSDFGDASTPRVGLLWSPVSGLNLRGTYARAFRPPTLRELDPTTADAFVFPITLFGFPDTFSSDGSSVLLAWGQGVREDLRPEFSDTITLGVDFTPDAVPNLKISATYFNIDYTDRLGFPSGFASVFRVLSDAAAFPFVFNSSPTLNDFEQIVDSIVRPSRFIDLTGMIADPTDPAAIADVVTVVSDNRRDNLAESKSEGIDVSIDYSHGSFIGDLNYGLRMTNTLTSSQRLTEATPELSLLDTVGNPISLRLRGYLGLRRGGFSSQVNVNHVGSYENLSVTPEQPVDSWTTVDLNLRYVFDGHASVLLNDLAVSFTVQNLFDVDPPFVENRSFDAGLDGLTKSVGFDPVNANAIGRFVTVAITKQF